MVSHYQRVVSLNHQYPSMIFLDTKSRPIPWLSMWHHPAFDIQVTNFPRASGSRAGSRAYLPSSGGITKQQSNSWGIQTIDVWCLKWGTESPSNIIKRQSNLLNHSFFQYPISNHSAQAFHWWHRLLSMRGIDSWLFRNDWMAVLGPVILDRHVVNVSCHGGAF